MGQCQRIVTNLRKQECHNHTDHPLCFGCLKLLRQVIIDLKEYTDELETQITRQDKGAPSLGGGSGEPRLAFDIEASRARDQVEISLSHWFSVSTLPEAHRSLQGLAVEQRIDLLLSWYKQFYVYLGQGSNGPEILASLDSALQSAQRACDRKQSKVWIGNCCNTPVMAYPKQQTMAKCEVCESEYDPRVSRRSLRVEGGNQHVTVKQAMALGEIWGRKFNANTIKSWHRRDKIKCQNPDCAKGCEHKYRMSDLLALHKEN